MLARLQQFLTLGALLLAALWAVLCTRAGHPAWAAAGALLIVVGYALVLALEFTLLRRAHGDDPAPRASAAQLLHAWWGEVFSAPLVFCWRQPFRSHRWPDHLPANAAGRRGVLLVHGLVCNRGVWNGWLQRLTTQDVPVVAVNLEPVFGCIDDGAAAIETGMRRLEACTGVPPVVVAHSMGGLALRRWWADHDGDRRVWHAITLGTPHHGAWLARLAISANTRQMRQRSAWLRELAAAEPAGRAQRYTCFYSHCDNIVFPASTATLPGADNRHLDGVAHLHMVDHPAPWQALQCLLQPPSPNGPASATAARCA